MINMILDLTSESAPASEQLQVGQFGFNANTGILYAKKADGSVIKWPGIALCDTITDIGGYPVPLITFSNTNGFCCGGAALTVTINNLLVNTRYKMLVSELTDNNGFSVSEFNTSLLPLNSSQRSLILNMTIGASNPTAMVKFSIYRTDTINSVDVDTIMSEKILVLTCQQC